MVEKLPAWDRAFGKANNPVPALTPQINVAAKKTEMPPFLWNSFCNSNNKFACYSHSLCFFITYFKIRKWDNVKHWHQVQYACFVIGYFLCKISIIDPDWMIFVSHFPFLILIEISNDVDVKECGLSSVAKKLKSIIL